MSSKFRQFLENEDGNASLEFVIVFPFFMFIFVSIVELGFLATRAVLLERGLDMAAREIRLDLIDDISGPNGHFFVRQRICEFSTILTNCNLDLHIELQPYDENAAFPQNEAACQDRSDRVFNPKSNFNPGGRAEIMFIRACMVVELLVPGWGLALRLPQDDDGGFQLVTYTAFMNEPN